MMSEGKRSIIRGHAGSRIVPEPPSARPDTSPYTPFVDPFDIFDKWMCEKVAAFGDQQAFGGPQPWKLYSLTLSPQNGAFRFPSPTRPLRPPVHFVHFVHFVHEVHRPPRSNPSPRALLAGGPPTIMNAGDRGESVAWGSVVG